MHESPERRESHAAHGKIGYFTDMAREHHRCYKIYVPETGGMRIAATVEFFPKHVQMPKTSSGDRLAATIEDLSHVLQNPHLQIPFLEQGTPTNDAI